MKFIANKNRAFTLIELLIVIAIATILATLSLTTLQGLLKDQKISASVRLARQYIETARTRAMATGRPVALFLERVSPYSDGSGNANAQNHTCTRMSIGEVFPPYTGENQLALATLWDVQLSVTRAQDGFADQARFAVDDVVTAFGTSATSPGMVSIGDTIEFQGNNQRFIIESINFVSGGTEVAITFFNPPATYNSTITAGMTPAGREPTLRVPAAQALASETAATPALTPAPTGVSFRVYRKPSKSLVGSITMPRGTCIDLSVSGIGPSGSALEMASPFHLDVADLAPATAKRSSYSRVALLFNPEGRIQGIYHDGRYIVPGSPETVTNIFDASLMSSKVYLMVGRTEQVIPDAPMTAPAAGERGDALGNLMDPGNTWISINPFTGLIESSPVAAVTDVSSIPVAVEQSRRFAAMGVNDGGR